MTDPADPRIEAYRNIRERDLIGREQMFVAEGKVVLAMLLQSEAYRPVSLLIAEHRIETLSSLLETVPGDVPIYAAAQPVLDAIAGFAIHRGILALGRRIETPNAETLLRSMPPRADILLLSGIANHDNMGGLFRNAAAFGVRAVLLDRSCCDPLYRKAIRVSVGAALLVPFAYLGEGEDPIMLLERHAFTPLALSPAGTTTLKAFQPQRRNAVLLGAEGPGLPADLIDRSISICIPMAPGFDSLNVATTSGIVLHHLLD